MEMVMNVVEQTPIEIALEIDEEGFTTARALFDWLQDEKNYSRWLEKNITCNPFAEGEFFTILSKTSKQGGRPMENYRITASLAKKISMTSKTERGEQARAYFIACEKLLIKLAKQKAKVQIEREKGVVIRQALTKAIQQSTENVRMHGHAYSTYTNMVYKMLFNKNANELRELFGIGKKDDLRDCFSDEELKDIQNAEMFVSSLVGYGYGYDEIKVMLQSSRKRMLAMEG